AGRTRLETENLIGFFVNTLVIRTGLGGDPTFREVLARVRDGVLEAQAHQDVPFERLVEELEVERSLAHTPLFQVMFTLEQAARGEGGGGELRLGGADIAPVASSSGTAKFDLTLGMSDFGDHVAGSISYRAELFDPATVERMAGHLARLLEQAAADPDLRLSELELLDGAERRRVVEEWNATARPYPRGRCVHELFAERAARAPDAVAVEFGDQRLSYAELDARAGRLARRLRAMGVGPETVVALCLDRSPALVVGALAVLEAGGAYLPLDPDAPAERLRYMLEDSGARVLLTRAALSGRAAEAAGAAVEVVLVDAAEAAEADAGDGPEELVSGVGAENLAYVIYTSGSTGRPKGVQVTHGSLANLVGWHREAFGVTAADRATLVASPGFDAAVWETWPYLAAGACLCIPDDAVRAAPAPLCDWMVAAGVTVSFLPTPLAESVLALAWPADAALRLVLTGGDRLASRPSPDLPWRLVNNYGPTENTVVSTSGVVEPRDGRDAGAPTIGRPVANTRAYVLDASLRPAPVGVAGELYVGGDGLARGYLGRPALTAERFVPDPFAVEPGARLYRTGDRARWRADGEIEFLGRLDFQVKVRGFRIEPGEIEAALLRHPQVREAVVLAREDRPGEKRLVAYVVADGGWPGADALRAHLSARLPDYMVPGALVELDALPLTSSGKVDRRALPAPELAAERPYVAPRTAAEEVLAATWSAVLGVERVGVEDNFFELGGHSLIATRVVSRVRSAFGVELPLRAVFEAQTVRALAARVEALGSGGATLDAPPIVPVPRDLELPLSFAQQRLWFIDRLQPGSAAYNIPVALRLRGELDAAALAWALTEVVRRHEVLRTTFGVGADGEPVQVVHAPAPVRLPVIDLAAADPDRREALVGRRANDEASRPFDLARGPVLRCALLRLGAGESVVLFTMHHIASDGWSMEILQREVTALYGARARGDDADLPELPVQYADYAVWQRRWLEGEVLERQVAYWRDRLSGAPAVLELPADHPRPAVAGGRGAGHAFALPPELSRALRELSRREGATLFMTLLAAWSSLLARYGAGGDVPVGTPVAGRTRLETEGLIGFFVNTLVIRTRLDGDPTFREVLGRVREGVLEAQAHQDLPFERLIDELAVERSLAHTPLFQVSFTLEQAAHGGGDGGGGGLRLGGAEIAPVASSSGTAKFDLTLGMSDFGDHVAGTISYRAELFDAATVERMAGHLARLLERAAADPDARLSEIELLDGAERRQVLEEWNAADADLPERTLHALFAAQAARTPDAPAAEFAGETLTYASLDARAERLARRLRCAGVGPETVVALSVERSLRLPVALLGVLKAGGAYLPLDPSYPPERLRYMLEDSRAGVLLTERAVGEGIAAELSAAGGTVVFLDEDDEHGGDAPERAAEPGPAAAPGNLAYVIYTSGTTGRPKGVMVTHRSAARLVMAQTEKLGFGPGERVLQFAPLSFDTSVAEIFTALCSGSCLVGEPADALLPGAPLARLLAERRITHAKFTPSALAAVPPAALPELRTLVVGGEACTGELVARWGEGRRFINVYGPTEATVRAAWAELTPADAVPPIGRPLAGARLYVLDEAFAPRPVGVAGELYVGGEGVARGYLGRPALTAERFVPDPFAVEPGMRLYRTGDRARWRSDGQLDFLGRVDEQVKVRGYRIEPGEIEAVLREHADVREAAVVAREDRSGEKRLVAYVVGGEAAEPRALRAHLSARLPDYMVPGAFVRLEALPLTPSGKVDRRALPAPDRAAAGAYLAPRTAAEEVLAGIWGEVLDLERVGVEDNFFELGGHSLVATRVVSRVRQAFGVEIPLRAVFEAQTVGALARRVEEMRGAGAGVQAPPVVPVPRDGELPLSFAQQRLWFLDRLQPGSAVYNIPIALRLQGALDAGALARALTGVARRHEVLRTTFAATADGRPVQVVHPPAPVPLPVVDLSALDAGPREAEAARLASEEASRPFDLARGPVLRCALLRLDAGEAVGLFTLHHIASDGWSTGILRREVTALYEAAVRGEEADLPALPVQYADYAVWQRRWLEGEVLDRQVAYWRGRLAGAPAVQELPLDRPRPAVASREGRAHGFALPPGLSGALRELSRREGASLYMTLLAAWQALLARYGTGDVVVGTPVAGRTRLETEGLIGFFVNTLVIRAGLEGDPTFREAVARARDAVLEAQANQDVPFERLVEELEVERSLAHTPLFQVVFTFEAAAAARGDDGLRLGPVESAPVAAESGTAKFDLTLAIRDTGERLAGVLEYRAELFDPATVERMAGHLARLLEQAAADPDLRLSELDLLDGAERRRVVEEWNATARPYPREACVHELFAEQAARAPDAVAVEFGDQRLSYAELSARAGRLARRLRGMGVGPETVVALCLDRSPALVVGALAVLEAGGAYLPLDPDAPAERLRYMLEDSGARVLLTRVALGGRAAEAAGAAVEVVLVDAPDADAGEGPAELVSGVGAENLAYVIYTSGSTGRPKGVQVTHGSLANLVGWHREAFGVTAADRATLVASPGFDAAVWETWPYLAAGATLCIPDDAVRAAPAPLRDWMTAMGVTVAFLPTPLAESVLALAWPEDAALRLVLTGGDRLGSRPSPELPWRLVNNYGPTENTVVSTSGVVEPRDGRDADAPSIGRPVANTRAYVLDASLRPAPVGVAGELYVGGDGLARGYLGRPALTAERFVPDPFAVEPGARLYRTGDRARWRADGEIEFMGRLDFQVKVRGHRIEPGEIEAALLRHPEVREAVVVARGDGEEKRLVAYVVPAPGAAPGAVELRGHLSARLPAYMVPAAFVALPALPLTTSGKVDRGALPEPGDGAAARRAYVPPRDALELELVRAWEEILGVEPVGVHDEFFALGGHSLLAIRLLARVEARTGHRIPVDAVFTAGTPEGFARLLRGQVGGDPSPLVAIRPSGARRPLFLVHAAGGSVLAYAELARRLGPDQPVYGLRARGLADGERPHAAIPDMAADYLQALRAVQPRGPYQVAGWSMGAVVALEMARQLEDAGEEVSLLAVIDPALPGPDGAPGDEPALLRQFARDLGVPAEDLDAVPAEAWEAGSERSLGSLLERARALHLVPPDLHLDRLERMFGVFRANVEALGSHVPAPFGGEITVLLAGTGDVARASARSAAWERLAGRGAVVRSVPGDHFTLLREPHVEEVARELARRLDADPPPQGGGSSGPPPSGGGGAPFRAPDPAAAPEGPADG
ncbi:MAG TPA: amino acid adenylation domain-containing protein, partial [Longimicrobium sp.]